MADLFNSKAEAGAYLSAMIDGEGSLFTSQRSRRVEIVNTDDSIIDAIKEACDVLGITYITKHGVPRQKTWKPYTILRMSNRTNLELIREYAAPRSTVKLMRLDVMLASYQTKAVAA